MSRAQLTSTTQQDSGGAVAPFLAGKNKIINGDFAINQRGFTSTTSSGIYNFDRWVGYSSGGTVTYSSQNFTLGSAPVAGYESANYLQIATTGQSAAGDDTLLDQKIESVRTFAGQTVTYSFWAKATSGTPSVALEIYQIFGTGGSPSGEVDTYGGKVTLSTSWARYFITTTIPSIAGKTIGTDANSSFIGARLWLSAGSNYNGRSGSLGIQNSTMQFWGLQLEAGSVATPFTTASNTLQGELALAQRYYQQNRGQGTAYASNGIGGPLTFPVQMRTTPTMSIVNNQLRQTNSGGTTTPSPNFVFGVDATGCTYIFASSFSTSLSTGSSCSYDFVYIASAEL